MKVDIQSQMLNLLYFFLISKKIFEQVFLALDNQILCDGCPKDKWNAKFFSYPDRDDYGKN